MVNGHSVPPCTTRLTRCKELNRYAYELAQVSVQNALKSRTLTALYNERPAWLDLAHRKLDAAVALSYGWPADLSDAQVLERLLALNLARATDEAVAKNSGHSTTKRKPQREKQINALI